MRVRSQRDPIISNGNGYTVCGDRVSVHPTVQDTVYHDVETTSYFPIEMNIHIEVV